MEDQDPVKNKPIRTLWDTVLLYLIAHYKQFENNLTLLMTPNEIIVLLNKLILKVDKLSSWNSRDRFNQSLILKDFISQILRNRNTFRAIFYPYNGNNTSNETLNYIFTRTKVNSYGGRYFRTIAIKNSLENAAFYKCYAKFIEENDSEFVRKGIIHVYTPDDIVQYFQYVKIIFNFALFLLYTGNYEIALNILQITRGTFAILASCKYNKTRPQKLFKKILLVQKHCLNLVFITSNNLKNGKVAQEILKLGIEEYDDDNETDDAKRRKICDMIPVIPECRYHLNDCSHVIAKTIFYLEASKYWYNLGNVTKCLTYMEQVMPIEAELPLNVTVDLLRHTSFLFLKLEQPKKAMEYIQACLCIFYFIINRNNNYVLPNPQRLHGRFHGYNKTSILFLDLIHDYSKILIACDFQWNCNRTSEYAAVHLENCLGKHNLKSILAEKNRVECRLKSSMYRQRMFFMYSEYPHTDPRLYLVDNLGRMGNCFSSKPPTDQLLYVETKILKVIINHVTAYSHYHPSPEENWSAQWGYTQKFQHKTNVNRGTYPNLYIKFEECIDYMTNFVGGDEHPLLAKLLYRFGLLQLQANVIGPYLIAKIHRKGDGFPDAALPDSLIKKYLDDAVKLIRKGLAIEQKLFGSNHYKYLQHRAMYLGDYYWTQLSLGYLLEKDKIYFTSLYVKCADKIEKIFGTDHSVLRFCYSNLIRIYKHKFFTEAANANIYQEKLRAWDVDYEHKNTREKNNWLTTTWLRGGNNVPTEWRIDTILNAKNSTSTVKNLVRVLYERHALPKKLFDPYEREHKISQEN